MKIYNDKVTDLSFESVQTIQIFINKYENNESMSKDFKKKIFNIINKISDYQMNPCFCNGEEVKQEITLAYSILANI